MALKILQFEANTINGILFGSESKEVVGIAVWPMIESSLRNNESFKKSLGINECFCMD